MFRKEERNCNTITSRTILGCVEKALNGWWYDIYTAKVDNSLPIGSKTYVEWLQNRKSKRPR